MQYKLILLSAFFSGLATLLAQGGDVNLTLIGQGKTIEEAQQQAFRDTVMQTYGAFVSCETEVVGEKPKADLVNTISNGVVKKCFMISISEYPESAITTMLKVSVVSAD